MNTCLLGEAVSSSRSGFASGKRSADGVVQLRMNNVRTDGTLDLTSFIRVPATKKQVSELSLTDGDVLFNCTNSPELVGKTCLFKSFPEPVVFSNHFVRLRTQPKILFGGYLARWLAWTRDKGVFTHGCVKWVNQATFRKDDLLKLRIPLPPLAEQKRIAGILDAADALRTKRRESLAQLDTLLQSTFLAMFGDPVTNPIGWEIVGLGQVAGFHAGSTLPAGEDFVGQEGGFLYLKVGDLNHPLNSEAVVRSNIWSEDAKKGITAPKDAVVIPKRGGAIGTNKKRLLSRNAVLDPNLMAISGSESLDHVYLYRWFHTFDLMSITSGSTVPQLNKRDLAPLRIPLPPVDLQRRFAVIVESVEQQRASQYAHLAELDTLFAFLQSRAFRGDL